MTTLSLSSSSVFEMNQKEEGISESVNSETKDVCIDIRPTADARTRTLAKFQIEQDLQPTLIKINERKARKLTLKRLAPLVLKGLLKELRNQPLTTMGKASLVGISILFLYPLVLSAMACLNPFRLENPNDIFSSDTAVANEATQLYSNTGHSVGYIWEGLGITACALTLLIRQSYQKAAGEIIEKIYRPCLEDPLLTKEQSDFLYKRREKELAQYGLMSPLPSAIKQSIEV
ncbi:hypothetical protein [Candidatus Protochlamydia phocaeensis]|uniref:hypothetical protein n=1 Tax=Candidatus Protochlamydia phocaeensis TaxID=1414722 RepID=UPI000839109A|nr:hypothetical protein [Candidatus Protochlamydia phocaeensis]